MDALPIFEYRCLCCNKAFEMLVRRPERDAAPACPNCGAAKAERLPSSPAGRTGLGAGCGGTSSKSR